MKRLILMIVAVMMCYLAPADMAFAGGGDPFLGDWNNAQDKAQSFAIHRNKKTSKYEYHDQTGTKEMDKLDEHTLTVATDAGKLIFALDTGSGSMFLEKNGARTEYRKDLHFVKLTPFNFTFLLLVGLIGGLVSGFIGSGGAFVLTPGMMSLGVDGLVAVASNMCHKFPKAMVGAYKRYKYGQIDLKMGSIMACSAIGGVMVGIKVQQKINELLGDAGSNLYVSLMFVIVLVVVGSIVFNDARKLAKSGAAETTTKLAKALQKINLFPVVDFNRAGFKMSVWFTVPIGFATGFLAATIAVGGFVGVPGMIFVMGMSSLMASATELVIAFGMGFVGSIQWGMLGLIDIRLTLIILAGSLIGVQLGALGTTYVKEYMIKIVMGTIMLMVAVSRGLAVPVYLNDLEWLSLSKSTASLLNNVSFGIMCFALFTGAVIILKAMIKGMMMEKASKLAEAKAHGKI